MLFNTKLGREGCHSITFRFQLLTFSLQFFFIKSTTNRNMFDDSPPLPGLVLPGEELLADLGCGGSQGWLQSR